MKHETQREIDETTLVTTRRSLHGVAELVLAGPQFRRAGSIELRATPGGFGTVTGRDLRVDGDELVSADTRTALSGLTFAALAESVGVTASELSDVYAEGPGLGEHDLIEVDRQAAAILAQAFELGDGACRMLAPRERPILWPEHFDIGISVAEVNYGVSPGDTHVAGPYAYVSPWSTDRMVGEFWNAPFGAVRPMTEFADADGVLAFFLRAQESLG